MTRPRLHDQLASSIRPQDGPSQEDELFRKKWGWAAYDLVRREALNYPPIKP